MSNFKDSPKYDAEKNDYYTQKVMWENVSHLIPKDKVIWEACMLNSKSNSIQYWKELGYDCIGDTTWNMLNCDIPNCDIIITNPPFKTDLKKQILSKLIEIDKPFILVMNTTNIFSKYMRDIFKDNIKYIQIVVPKGKIIFEEYDEETDTMIKCKKQPSFYCSYICYKMDIPQDKLWLD